eukprot:875517-Alexandrium_andersonii.AAC.1
MCLPLPPAQGGRLVWCLPAGGRIAGGAEACPLAWGEGSATAIALAVAASGSGVSRRPFSLSRCVADA